MDEQKARHVALSTVDAEYIAAYEVRREAIWLRKLLSNPFEGLMNPTMILLITLVVYVCLKIQYFMERQGI